MIRSDDVARLEPWVASAKLSNLASFAGGVDAEKDAIAATIAKRWPNGQAEGQVNRLELIRQELYGRANLNMLKAHLTAAV